MSLSGSSLNFHFDLSFALIGSSLGIVEASVKETEELEDGKYRSMRDGLFIIYPITDLSRAPK